MTDPGTPAAEHDAAQADHDAAQPTTPGLDPTGGTSREPAVAAV